VCPFLLLIQYLKSRDSRNLRAEWRFIMPVVISQIRGELNESSESTIKKALKKSGIPEDSVIKKDIYKTSLDARKQNDIHLVHSVFVQLANPKEEKLFGEKKDCRYIENSSLTPVISKEKNDGRVVIAGFGPAGMFCGLVLAEYGYKPIIIERGQSVDSRIKSVKEYWSGGSLNTESNVQFGEGGAGTFSDGKLTTRINDPLCRYVLEQFVKFGAPEEILTKAKPHIGTDNLRNIVKSIRERIISLGGEIKFNTKLENIRVQNSKAYAAVTEDAEIRTSAIIAAVGHSARDTFEMLLDNNIFMQPKPFSVGVRIEHSQREVDESLYGNQAGNPLLPAGEYQLSYRRPDGRCVYTFCMCPGGVVVPAASEKDTIVTNGMSEFARNGENANAALVVSVSEKDFGSKALDGVAFARNLERKAYAIGKGKAPATSVGGFLSGKPSISSAVSPSYSIGTEPAELRELFPEYITGMLEEGLHRFSRKMKCFGNPQGIMTAPETRTSSPVRITRNADMTSISVSNLYPCGEGAGYAGGIMSAAVDGVKTALAVMSKIAPQ
jgi:hypothetical protein